MTRLALLADCILSGQVEASDIVRLRSTCPGLEAELQCRSRIVPACAGPAGQGGVSVPPPMRLTGPADPFNLDSQAALARCAGQKERRGPFKVGGFLSQFFGSRHLTSALPRKLWRQ